MSVLLNRNSGKNLTTNLAVAILKENKNSPTLIFKSENTG